ncbi:hypothetical protein AKJ44_00655 [candidate division MSBL1 archaeon SCGC-AAA261F17]|uniref:DUF7343 domain-containing protein n=1 Tax=candidate division MSBL1 archaeon SCGC-AAA261F17 TaxID=1698274 RepID=A0A133V7G5_9EURY|nr:hypothetical protein AKJ44_00655 [candidate division MSBL1 archaeon SCGC-AAA261F17]
MNLKEIASVIVLVIILQGGLTLLLFGLQGSTPGVGFWSIGVGILVMVVVSGGIAIVLYWLVHRYTTERAIRTAMMAMSDDEQEILRIIMQEKKIRQDDLRRRVDFSKSKVSALVTNLVEKNAVKKTQYKRTNHLEPTEQFQR